MEPLKSGTNIRHLNHHWMSNRDPQTSSDVRDGSNTSHDVEWRSSSSPTDAHTQGGTLKAHGISVAMAMFLPFGILFFDHLLKLVHFLA